jgi:hypothetical protein
MNKLKDLKHEVVRNKTVNQLTNDTLSQLLIEWRKNYEYEIKIRRKRNIELFKPNKQTLE